ncbi:MAG: DUF3293 domain-containing protein [Gammaproteobacteria bacterium]|nr:DUF3293 domain-containing protein [Gammaproteobacteria bacterium]
MSTPRADLLEAFKRTIYRVYLPGYTLDLCIGTHLPQLDVLLLTLGARRWIVFSPCNPGARLLDPETNMARMTALRENLDSEGLRHFPAEGIPPEGEDWPPEPSLLILDVPQRQIARWAHRFGQLAWVAGELGQPAELVWSSLPKV